VKNCWWSGSRYRFWVRAAILKKKKRKKICDMKVKLCFERNS
jgi:hypothetical protein